MTITELEEQLSAATTEAESARERATALEQKIIDGDQKVGMAQVEAEESKARYADLKVRKIERELETVRTAERDNAIKAIRTEIESSEISDPEHFIKLLHDVETAILAFTAAADERSARVYDWQSRLNALEVPPMGATWEFPPDDQFGIAPYGHNYTGYYRIRIDDTTIGTIQPKSYLDSVFTEPDAGRRVRDLANDLRSELGSLASRRRK
jgi:hypothetical protein